MEYKYQKNKMLRNLKNSYTDSFAYEMAITCNQMILRMVSNSPDEIRDLGLLEEKRTFVGGKKQSLPPTFVGTVVFTLPLLDP